MFRLRAFSAVLLVCIIAPAAWSGDDVRTAKVGDDRSVATNGAADLAAVRRALDERYRKELESLAQWCDTHGLGDQRDRTRAWQPHREPDKLYLFVLAESEQVLAVPDDASAEVKDWQTRFRGLRQRQADALFALAGRAMREHQPTTAFELVVEAARENPDHVEVRRLLGYVKFRDEWHTPFEVRQLSAGKQWTDAFGWLPKSYVARYEQGERFHRGRWMSAAEEARSRAKIDQGWRVESDHYTVITNHSLEAGVQLSRRLERLHELWKQVFVRYLVGEAELNRWFEGRAASPRDARPHKVVYYRTRQEYNDALRAAQSRIDITLGIYFDTVRTAYFFEDKEQDAGTLYHEATHQLFHESRSVAGEAGRRQNFWIVEGIACYMESLSGRDGCYTLGGLEAGRMPAARVRLLRDNFYVPLAKLVDYGMEDLQRDPQVAKVYSQSAGLATFLMHYDNGRYREPLLGYLDEIYAGRADSQTLARLTGQSYEALDAQYREFLRGPTEQVGQTAADGLEPAGDATAQGR